MSSINMSDKTTWYIVDTFFFYKTIINTFLIYLMRETMFYVLLYSSFFLLGEQAIRHFLSSCSRKAHHQDRVSVDILHVSDKKKRCIPSRIVYDYIKLNVAVQLPNICILWMRFVH